GQVDHRLLAWRAIQRLHGDNVQGTQLAVANPARVAVVHHGREIIGRDQRIPIYAGTFGTAFGRRIGAVLLMGKAQGMPKFVRGDAFDAVLLGLGAGEPPAAKGEIHHHAIGHAVEVFAQTLYVWALVGNANTNTATLRRARLPSGKAQLRVALPGLLDRLAR